MCLSLFLAGPSSSLGNLREFVLNVFVSATVNCMLLKHTSRTTCKQLVLRYRLHCTDSDKLNSQQPFSMNATFRAVCFRSS